MLGLVLWWVLLPPFHIISIEKAREDVMVDVFDPDVLAETFWTEELPKRVREAVDVEELISKLGTDREATAKQYGHRLGLSGKSAYFVSGTGKIKEVRGSKIFITLNEGGVAQVVIGTGPVFGNAIRDGSGILDVSDFGNSQNFNAISSEINRRVEERVLPELRGKALVEAQIQFVGGVEVSDRSEEILPLTIVPFSIEFR